MERTKLGDKKNLTENQWDMELLHRIDELEKNSKEIKRMTKKDYITAGVITAICLCIVVVGAFIH